MQGALSIGLRDGLKWCACACQPRNYFETQGFHNVVDELRQLGVAKSRFRRIMGIGEKTFGSVCVVVRDGPRAEKAHQKPHL